MCLKNLSGDFYERLDDIFQNCFFCILKLVVYPVIEKNLSHRAKKLQA